MAKKRRNPFEDPYSNDGIPEMDHNIDLPVIPGLDIADLAPLISELTNEEGMALFAMIGELVERGVTPEKYSTFYKAYTKLSPLLGLPSSGKKNSQKKEDDECNGTFLLKIQMKGVAKPPMWREVEVSADMNFYDLHDVIQCVVGLENSHLWGFSDRDPEYEAVIGIQSMGAFDPGLEEVTDKADETALYEFLWAEGMKLEYIYDYGDNWVFTVSLKKILSKPTLHPVCTAFKSELNAIEDTGGPWRYVEMRANLENWKKLSKKQKEDIADRMGFDSPEDYYSMLQDSLFNIDEVNQRLQNM